MNVFVSFILNIFFSPWIRINLCLLFETFVSFFSLGVNVFVSFIYTNIFFLWMGMYFFLLFTQMFSFFGSGFVSLQYFFSLDGNCADMRYFHLATLAANTIFSYSQILLLLDHGDHDDYDDDDDDDDDGDDQKRRGCTKCKVKNIPINLLSAFASQLQSTSWSFLHPQQIIRIFPVEKSLKTPQTLCSAIFNVGKLLNSFIHSN